MLKRIGLFPIVLTSLVVTLSAQSGSGGIDAYRPAAARLIAESQRSDFAWQRLAEITDTFGPRLSGSDALERALDWAVAQMKKDGLENVHKEPVMVPKWVRGRESLDLVDPIRQPLPMLGLGNSVGTPAAGVEGDVLVVSNFDELKARAADVKGRIVLFNAVFTNYGDTVVYRGTGPSEAAKLGAIAVLVRSVGPPGLRTTAHRVDELRGGRAEDPGRGHQHRGRRPLRAAAGPRRARARQALHGRPLRAGRPVL